MVGPDRESRQDWLVPELGGPAAASAEGLAGGPGERSPPMRARKRLDWRIEAAAASVDAWAGLLSAVAEELDRVHEASTDAAVRSAAAAEIAERAAASAAGAHALAAERSDRVDRAEARVGDLAVRVEAALAELEAGERATVRRSEQAERGERSLRSFAERAERVVRLLREAEQAASASLERHSRRPRS
jgi:hypothetical protein